MVKTPKDPSVVEQTDESDSLEGAGLAGVLSAPLDVGL